MEICHSAKSVILLLTFCGIILLSFVLIFINSKKTLMAVFSCILIFIFLVYIFLGAYVSAVIQLIIFFTVYFLLVWNEKYLTCKKDLFPLFSLRFYFGLLAIGLLFISMIYINYVSLSLESNSDWQISEVILNSSTSKMLHSMLHTAFCDYFYISLLILLLVVTIFVGFYADKGSVKK